MLFIDYTHINEKGIRIPDMERFVKVGLKRSEKVKNVI